MPSSRLPETIPLVSIMLFSVILGIFSSRWNMSSPSLSSHIMGIPRHDDASQGDPSQKPSPTECVYECALSAQLTGDPVT
jgi:hypothetical protein